MSVYLDSFISRPWAASRMAIAVGSPSSPVLLIAHYTCDDDAANGVVADALGAYDAALHSGNTADITSTGVVGQSLHLTGGNYIVVASPYDDQAATRLQFEAHFKLSAWGEAGGYGEYAALADSGTGNPDDNGGFYIIVDNRESRNNHISFAVMTDGGLHSVHTEGGLLSLGEWFKVKCVYEDGTAKIYIDDVEKSITESSTGSGDFIPRSGGNLGIGAINDGGSPIDGYVDNVKLYC